MYDDIKSMIREGYARIVTEKCIACSQSTFACGLPEAQALEAARRMGYTSAEIGTVPETANLGLGCGHPVRLASLRPGETVLDLGAGAGMDALLAARLVGPEGLVIGLDFTPEMTALAWENARACGGDNTVFAVGDMEAIPLADAVVDVVIANCAINLAPDKERAFREAARVLKPGGRIAVADIVLLAALPEVLLGSVDAYIGCLSGAALYDEYLAAIAAAGFTDVTVVRRSPFLLAFFPFEAVLRVVRACLSPAETAALERSIIALELIGCKV